MKLGFEMVCSQGLQTDLHWSTDFTGSRTSISVMISSGKSDRDLFGFSVILFGEESETLGFSLGSVFLVDLAARSSKLTITRYLILHLPTIFL